MTIVEPTDTVERELFAAGTHLVIGCDEVGRGALAGPVAVGMVVLSATCGPHPDGLRDSKLLSEKRRVELDPLVRGWAMNHAVGMADATEVDEVGIIAALGLAGKRALADLFEQGVDVTSAVILLDGAHNWLAPALAHPLDIRTRIKADRDCVSVAGASVIAKVRRDTLMIEHDAVLPGYGWRGNKGYSSSEHMEAIARLGASVLHRRTWLSVSA